MAVFETTIRKVGASTAVTLTDEFLAALDVKDGDTDLIVRGDDGFLRIMPYGPELARSLATAEIVMDDNRDLLKGLA